MSKKKQRGNQPRHQPLKQRFADVTDKQRAEVRATIERMKPLVDGGTVTCEYKACLCPFRAELTTATVNTLQTPEGTLHLVCERAMEDAQRKQNLKTQFARG